MGKYTAVSYTKHTPDWVSTDAVWPVDMNRIETGISDVAGLANNINEYLGDAPTIENLLSDCIISADTTPLVLTHSETEAPILTRSTNLRAFFCDGLDGAARKSNDVTITAAAAVTVGGTYLGGLFVVYTSSTTLSIKAIAEMGVFNKQSEIPSTFTGIAKVKEDNKFYAVTSGVVGDQQNIIILGVYFASSSDITDLRSVMPVKIDPPEIPVTRNNFNFGVCDTAAATTEKEVTINGLPINLTPGQEIKIKFTNGNSADVPTIKINSNITYALYSKNGTAVSATCPFYPTAGTIVTFFYDGTGLVYVNEIVEEYTSGYDWHRIWSNGFIEQGGRTRSLAPDENVTINLPLIFPANILLTACVSIINSSTSNDDIFPRILSKSSTQLTVKAEYTGAADGTRYIEWYYCGY